MFIVRDPFVNQFTDLSVSTELPPEVSGHCPGEHWGKYGRACFLFRPDAFVTWVEAEQACLNEGGEE